MGRPTVFLQKGDYDQTQCEYQQDRDAPECQGG